MTENLNHLQNPETPSTESEVIEQTKKDVDKLKSQVEEQQNEGFNPLEYLNPLKRWDLMMKKLYPELKELGNDPELKSGFTKILENVLGNNRINTFKEQYEPREKKHRRDIESWTKTIIKRYPGLQFYICGDLGLPYDDSDVPGFGTKFSELTFNQKLGFMALHDSLRPDFDISKIKPETLIKKCEGYLKDCYSTLEDNLKTLSKGNMEDHLENYLNGSMEELLPFMKNKLKNPTKAVEDLSTAFQKEYGLTKSESKKIALYLNKTQVLTTDILKKIGIKTEGGPEEADSKLRGKIIVFLTIVVICITICFVTYTCSGSVKDLNPYTEDGTIKQKGGILEVVGFEELDKLVVGEANCISLTEDGSKPRYLSYDRKPIKTKKDKKGLIGRLEKAGADVRNYIQGTSLKIDVKEEKVQYSFDAKSIKINLVPNGNGTYKISIKTKKPKPEALAPKYEVVNAKRQLFETKLGREFEAKCVEDIQNLAIEKAQEDKWMDKAKESLGKNILNRFNSYGYYSGTTKVEAGKFSSVTVEYED